MVSQLKVNEIIKQSGSSISIGESGDTITLPSTATLTNFPTNTPLVQAGFSSASQSISSGSDTEIVYTVVTKETPSGKFSTSTGRFTPGVVGFYYVNALARINAGNGAGEFGNLQIRVNGQASTSGSTQGPTYRRYQDDGAENSFEVSGIIELTSVTDYISVFIYQSQGGSQTLQPNHTNFSAYRLIT
jgi:hypothetical protein